MTDVRTLLPPNRTALESAVAQTLFDREHPVRDIATLYRADALATPLLPWLAWSQDVLAWPADADETLRRNLTAGSWAMHRRMGTLAGLREMAGYHGATVTGAIVPPAKTYIGAALTLAERNAFVQRYPQLRIYPQRTASRRVGAMLARQYLGDAVHPVQTDAAMRLAPQTYLYRDGVETPLQSIERETINTERQAQTITEVRRPGSAGALGFCGRPVRWTARSDAGARMYRLALDTPYLDGHEVLRRVAVTPGLEPLSLRYDWIAGRGTVHGVHAGQHVSGHLVRSSARERIYKRLWLFDPELSVSRRGAMSFCDASRLTMPAHHAQLSVSIPGRLHPQAARRFVRGFLLGSDKSGYHATLAGMRSMSRASDRIAINTAVTRPLAAGEATRAGAATAGEWRAT